MHHDHVMALAQMRHERYQEMARAAARTESAAPNRRRRLLGRRVGIRVASPVAVDARAAATPPR
jgi:hypothetical protein